MATIVGLSGSLRKGSFNTMLLRAAAELTPAGSTITIDSIEGIPLYNQDVEDVGIPSAVQQLKERIVAADGLLLVTPEYNNSMPGTLKNAIDWLSRPTADIAKVFRNRPLGMLGASSGPWGTSLAQVAWLPVFRTLGVAPFFGGRVLVPRAKDAFDDQGRLKDATIRGQLQNYVNGFVEFVEARRK
jgi:NAD(P)H-dependent FMN reductase